jgi:hypothetical protein
MAVKLLETARDRGVFVVTDNEDHIILGVKQR